MIDAVDAKLPITPPGETTSPIPRAADLVTHLQKQFQDRYPQGQVTTANYTEDPYDRNPSWRIDAHNRGIHGAMLHLNLLQNPRFWDENRYVAIGLPSYAGTREEMKEATSLAEMRQKLAHVPVKSYAQALGQARDVVDQWGRPAKLVIVEVHEPPASHQAIRDQHVSLVMHPDHHGIEQMKVIESQQASLEAQHEGLFRNLEIDTKKQL